MPTPDDTTEAPPVEHAEPTAAPQAAPAQPVPEAKLPAPRPPIRAGGSIQAIIPRDIVEAFRLGEAVFASGLVPYGYESPQAVTVAIMHGLEIGLPPMQAIQSIAVINGKPSLYGDAGLALVQASGLLETFEESYTGTPFEDDYTAVCTMKRVGGMVVTNEYSVKDAKVAGYWEGKHIPEGKRSKTPWVTNPKRMLRWRSRWFTMRDLFSDVLRGLGSAEEMMDVEPRDITPIPTAPVKRSLEERLATGNKPEVEIIPPSNEVEKINTGPESQPEATQSAETASGQDDAPADDQATGGATGAAEQWPEGVRQPADMFEASMVLEIAHAVRAADPPLTPERMAVLWGEFGETVQLMTGDGQEIARGLFAEAGEAVGVTGGPWII